MPDSMMCLGPFEAGQIFQQLLAPIHQHDLKYLKWSFTEPYLRLFLGVVAFFPYKTAVSMQVISMSIHKCLVRYVRYLHEIMKSCNHEFFKKRTVCVRNGIGNPKYSYFIRIVNFGFHSSLGFQEWALINWGGWSSHVRIRPRQDELQDFLGLSEDRFL